MMCEDPRDTRRREMMNDEQQLRPNEKRLRFGYHLFGVLCVAIVKEMEMFMMHIKRSPLNFTSARFNFGL